MLSVDIDSYRFQVRAAAVFLWQGSVLLHRIGGNPVWALPGGRVNAGEDASAAVIREMHEELDELIVCGQLMVVAENFYLDHGKSHHEIGLYFEASFLAGSRLLDTSRSHAGIEGDKQLEFRWFQQARLKEVDLRPAFLRDSLANRTLAFEHYVQRG